MLFFQTFSFSACADPTSGDQWEFQLAPYVWLAGQNGKVATLTGLPAADVDVDYEKDDFLYDVAQYGLTLGLSWRF